MSDQLVPSQCTANWSETASPKLPTAQMSLAEMAVIPWRKVLFAPTSVGTLATIDQLVPSQCSMRGLLLKPSSNQPTAQTLVAERATTPCRLADWTNGGLGLATADQVLPFQCSMKGVVS